MAGPDLPFAVTGRQERGDDQRRRSRGTASFAVETRPTAEQSKRPNSMRAVIFDPQRWEGFAFRDDIVIATGGKCGTTWIQMQVAVLLFRTPQLPASLATLSPCWR